MTHESLGNESGTRLSDDIVKKVLLLVEATPSFSDPSEPILGETDEVVLADNLEELIAQPETVVVTAGEDESLFGLSLAVPIGIMNPERTDESGDTAYIYYTAVAQDRQGQGVVGQLNEDMLEHLKALGYSYVELDAKIDNGYDEKLSKNYERAIEDSYDHMTWPDIGEQRFFRLDLAKV